MNTKVENLEAEDDLGINLAEMSDDEINNLDPETLVAGEETPTEGDASGENQSATDTTEDDNNADATGGAESVDASSDPGDGGADSNSAEESTDSGTDDQTFDQQPQASSSDQDENQAEAAPEGSEDSSGELDYKAEFSKLMAPFKAAKREIKVDNIDDARRLMQMGVDYSRKMEAMKPYQRVLKTLEKNDLLDIAKVNFLIDLDKKDPAAIRKFLKDSEIDPMDLSLEDDTDYKPTDHMIGDSEMELNDVLDDIRGTDTFERTVTTITDEWDTASRQVLMDNPRIIGIINDHMQAGIFDQIAEKVEQERVFGRLQGLSDLEAYKEVGDAIQAKGGFTPHPRGESPPMDGNGQDFSQDSGSGSAAAEKLRNRKRAASPTKGNASAGKPKVNIMEMSDAEIEKIDVNSL